jgi:hypothetical protein
MIRADPVPLGYQVPAMAVLQPVLPRVLGQMIAMPLVVLGTDLFRTK